MTMKIVMIILMIIIVMVLVMMMCDGDIKKGMMMLDS